MKNIWKILAVGIIAALSFGLLNSCDDPNIVPPPPVEDDGGSSTPGTPSTPSEPTDPSEPADPSEPGTPSEPTDPSTPTDPGATEIVIYSEDLDNEAAPDENKWKNFPGNFVHPEGSGASNLTYSCSESNVSVRKTGASSGYEDASGGNNVYFGGDPGWISIAGIALDPTKNTYELSFGSYYQDKIFSYDSGMLKVYVGEQLNDRDTEVKWSGPAQKNKWQTATATIKFTDAVPATISITFEAHDRLIRIDDIRIVAKDGSGDEGDGGDVGGGNGSGDSGDGGNGGGDSGDDGNAGGDGGGDAGGTLRNHFERPATLISNPDYKYITHYATTVSSNQRVRNYTSCYDVERHNPIWVASAHHPCYREGSGRSDPDPWRPDPKLAESEQSIIYSSDWNDWPWAGNNGNPTDRMWYWSPTYDLNKYFTKGHMLRSHDRPGKGKEINMQTFYPTNISPELYLHPNLWEITEGKLTDAWTCSDTTYVVTGNYYGDASKTAYDASDSGRTSEKSKLCEVPTARYRVILKTKSGNTGKAVWECSADELIAIGFWYPQKMDRTAQSDAEIGDFTFSVNDIEEKIGNEFEFFPELPEALQSVKDQRNLADWGLTETQTN